MAYSQDGGAGAIRDAGGSFSKKEAADEERYFRKMVKLFSNKLLNSDHDF